MTSYLTLFSKDHIYHSMFALTVMVDCSAHKEYKRIHYRNIVLLYEVNKPLVSSMFKNMNNINYKEKPWFDNIEQKDNEDLREICYFIINMILDHFDNYLEYIHFKDEKMREEVEQGLLTELRYKELIENYTFLYKNIAHFKSNIQSLLLTDSNIQLPKPTFMILYKNKLGFYYGDKEDYQSTIDKLLDQEEDEDE